MIKVRFPILLFAAFLTTEIISRLSEKQAVVVSTGEGFGYIVALLTNFWFWFGIVLAIMQLAFWEAVLRRADLSLVYPASSVNYVLTMILGVIIFDEKLDPLVWVGAIFITIGVALLGYENAQKETHL